MSLFDQLHYLTRELLGDDCLLLVKGRALGLLTRRDSLDRIEDWR